MTKKILLKWLEEQKVKALAQVDTQENAAKATLLAGPLSMSWGTILYSIQNVLLARLPMAEKLQETELREAQVDRDLKKRFSDIRREVENTYYNVALNVNALANAKLGLEYLSGLGFDLSGLIAEQEQPVEKALAVPINTSFLLIMPKEVHNESETV